MNAFFPLHWARQWEFPFAREIRFPALSFALKKKHLREKPDVPAKFCTRKENQTHLCSSKNDCNTLLRVCAIFSIMN
jgi:hypothetical protein